MAAPANILLAPLGAIYGLAIRARHALYDTGALKTHETGVPVISVGNITTGGTGKTPLVAWLARQLEKRGERVCILTRGYGRANQSQQVLVSDGLRVLASATEGGDEPRLLAEMLEGKAAIISNADRAAAAHWAKEHLQSSVFILDDGFQHLALARNLNLVTIDATTPWGGGKLIPHGRLREPLKNLARADAIIITRANLVSDLEAIRAQAESLSGGRPVLLSQTRTVRLRRLSAHSADAKGGKGDAIPVSLSQPIGAFCAIGNPQGFFSHLRRDEHTLAHTKAFPDHHVFTQSEIDLLCQEASKSGAESLVTTAKDEVKLRSLRFELPCYVIEIEMSFDDEQRLLQMMEEVLQKSRLSHK